MFSSLIKLLFKNFFDSHGGLPLSKFHRKFLAKRYICVAFYNMCFFLHNAVSKFQNTRGIILLQSLRMVIKLLFHSFYHSQKTIFHTFLPLRQKVDFTL